jgi:uncharacterized protein
LIDLILFGLVWFGHACIWTVITNILYSRPYHKPTLKITRLMIAILIFIIPPALSVGIVDYLIGSSLSTPPETRSLLCLKFSEIFSTIFLSMSHFLLGAYAIFSIIIGWICFPWLTIQRRRRKLPECCLESTYTIDVAKELGYIPAESEGKRARYARYRWNELFIVDFTTLHVHLKDLPPAWEGLSILHLSDLHFIGTPSKPFYTWVMDRCMSDGVPDLICVTGDLVDSMTHHRWIIPILGKLRWNDFAFGILGNHDWERTPDHCRRRYRRLKFHEIGNRWEQVIVRGEPMIVIGHEGPWFRPTPDLQDCPSGFRLCLSHTPDNIRWAQRNQIQLMLAGHNHGGQIRIPFFGSMFVPSWYSRRYDQGTFLEGSTLLHVNRGLGGKAPIRTLCHPQVTRIILHRASGAVA